MPGISQEEICRSLRCHGEETVTRRGVAVSGSPVNDSRFSTMRQAGPSLVPGVRRLLDGIWLNPARSPAPEPGRRERVNHGDPCYYGGARSLGRPLLKGNRLQPWPELPAFREGP